MDEKDSITGTKVWEPVDRPSRNNFIRNRLVFKIKHREDGLIDKFRGRLVVKGFIRVEHTDYEESCFLVVRFASIRLLLAMVAHLDLDLFQMDVKDAFLNSNLEEEIYIDQHIGFVSNAQEEQGMSP